MNEELYLIAAVAGRTVAIRSSQVDSVVDLDNVVPVPGVPQHVRGLAALRSKVVTVIDAATALGEASDAANRAAVITADGHVYAVLVERVDDVAPFAMSRLPDGVRLDLGWAQVARGVIARDGDMILVIDPEALIVGTSASVQPLAA